ncbi:hypothetical protein D9M69_559190 [compost metagenome]
MLLELCFQAIERQIRQGGRYDSALRRAGIRGQQLTFVHDTGLQPLPEYTFVHRNVGDQPVVVDVVEAALYVRLQNPMSRGLLGQADEQLTHRIRCRAFNTEAVAIRIARRFRDGRQSQQMKRRHGPVGHGRDAQGAFLSIRLGDEHTP